MSDIDIQADLNAVNDQLTKMVDELNRLNTAREQLIQQIQNMNGVAMYLRGKLPPEEQPPVQSVEEPIEEETTAEDDITRTVEYP